jgi:hypothetical protein
MRGESRDKKEVIAERRKTLLLIQASEKVNRISMGQSERTKGRREKTVPVIGV